MANERDKRTREQRLAEQLRENLKRRKAQARALAAGPAGDGPSPHDADD